jgi:hypothetical protein
MQCCTFLEFWCKEIFATQWKFSLYHQRYKGYLTSSNSVILTFHHPTYVLWSKKFQSLDYDFPVSHGLDPSDVFIVFIYPVDIYAMQMFTCTSRLFAIPTTHTFISLQVNERFTRWKIRLETKRQKAELKLFQQSTHRQTHNISMKEGSFISILFSSSVTLFRFCSLFTLHFFQNTHSIHKEISCE